MQCSTLNSLCTAPCTRTEKPGLKDPRKKKFKQFHEPPAIGGSVCTDPMGPEFSRKLLAMRTAFEELATEAEAAAGKVLAEKAEAEKVLAKKVLAEKAAAEKAATEKEATEKAAVEKAATEKAATENAAAVSRAVLKKQIGDTVGDTDDDTGTPGPPSPAPLWRGRGKVSSVARNATTPLTAEDSTKGV